MLVSHNDLDQLLIFAPKKIIYLNQDNLVYKALALPPLLIRQLGLFTEASQLGLLITFVNTSCFNYFCK